MLRILNPAIILMNKLKYVQKFSMIFLIFLIPIASMLTLNILQVNKDFNFTKKQRMGLDYNSALNSLIQHTQIHRGLTSINSDGKLPSVSLIQNNEVEIANDIKKVDKLNENFKSDLTVYSKWNDIKMQWNNIKYLGNFVDSFNSHTKLIQNMLLLNDYVTDNSKLLIQTRLECYALVDSIANKLPRETEFMGQARAIGAGIASRKTSTEAERTKLYFLMTTISNGLDEIINNMNKAYLNPQIKAELKTSFSDVVYSTSNMINEINTELINNEAINIDSNEYFNYTTNVINKIYDLQMAESNIVNKISSEDYNSAAQRKNLLLWFTFIVLIIIIYLFSGFYYSIKNGITTIEIAADNIASGKLTERVQLEANDETQKIGDALNRMVVTLIDNYNEVKDARNSLEKQAHYDNLTGIANRALFLDKLELMVNGSIENNKTSALLFMDLDRFKIINDTLGHAAGDIVLRTVALRLTDEIKSIGTVCRLGGDEFTVLMPNIESLKMVEETIIKLFDCIEKPMLLNGKYHSIGTSIGYALCPRDAKDPEELLKKADAAMYKIKEERKNKFLCNKKGIVSK